MPINILKRPKSLGSLLKHLVKVEEVVISIGTSLLDFLLFLPVLSNGGYSYDYATVPFLAEVFKVYSTSMAMLLTMVVSIFLFNFKPQAYSADLQVAYRAEPEMKNEVIIEQRTAS
ncbi:hypothetical protein MRB53_009620 [Persea americana]|uniref:Uncharacterized protein n=1 Tax=Persea americana TaxID=3435 RepID=A0ACC2LQA9_PERAE|nr:hypothetical protein MRB53_009620 [Persea americana]